MIKHSKILHLLLIFSLDSTFYELEDNFKAVLHCIATSKSKGHGSSTEMAFEVHVHTYWSVAAELEGESHFHVWLCIYDITVLI